MMRFAKLGVVVAAVAALGGCGSDYSPNTYASNAAQQANKVDQGVVIGYRQVAISADGTVGAVTGGAVGGILGAQTNSPTIPTALTALGGTVVGGLVGNTIEHAVGDTTGWEYIVRETKGDLISVTQREPTPIAIGQKVLVIEGKQARIVADYASPALETPSDAEKPKASAASSTTATSTTAVPTPSAASTTAASPSPPAAPSSSSAASSEATAVAPVSPATSAAPAPADSNPAVAKGPS